jgi:hypothetical protein
MQKTAQRRPCGSCLQPGSPVISERFPDNGSAFVRHAQLVRAGSAPSLCMRRDGSCYVCHFGQATR